MWAVEEGYQSNTLTPDAQGNTIKITKVNDYQFTIEAQPNTGYIFLRWLDNNTDNPRTVTIAEEQARQGDFEYKALFGFQKALATSQGTVTVTTVSAEDETFQLTVNPGSCSEGLKQWSNGKTTTTIDYVPANGLVTPLYNHLDMIYQNSPVAQGHIDITDEVCGFKLTAVPETGYHFAYWGDDHSTNPVRTITYEQIDNQRGSNDAEYEAYFTDAVVMGDGESFSTITAALAAGKTDISVFANLTENVVIPTGKEISLNGNNNTITGDLTIASGAKLTLSGEVTASNLYLSGQKGESSQLVGIDKLTLANGGHAYFDYTLVPGGSANTSSWYGFAVPFEVNVADGISDPAQNKVAVPEQDIRLTQFSGQDRATTGTGWTKNYLKSGTLKPGQFYMITLNSATNTWRFMSASNVLTGTSEIALSNYTTDGAAEVDKGWNSLANPLLYYANASTTAATNGYIYDNATGAYTAYPLSNYSFVVGSPLFLQVGENPGSLTFAADDKGENMRFAPAYEPTQDLSYTVTLSDNAYTDYLYLRASENATAFYERGRDLQKLTSTKVPQLWSMAYGENLAVEDAQLINNEVTYFLEMNAPQAGNYTLSARGNTDTPLYLLKDGSLIWNLSESACEIELEKGVNDGYSLRVMVIKGIATDIDIERYKKEENIRKFIYNGNLYIMRSGSLFNAQGVIVK